MDAATFTLPADLQACHALLRAQQEGMRQHEARLAEQQVTIAQLLQEKEGLAHRLDLLLRRVYGPRAERIDPGQLLLFGQGCAAAEQEQASPAPADGAVAPVRGRAKGHGRRELPANLPRHRLEHPVPPEELLCPCCGDPRTRMGEVISEQLDYIPASLFVLEHVRPKLACGKCADGGVVTANRPAPGQVIEKGLPGPGLVAQCIVSKYGDHLPLYRLEGIFSRHGVELSRSTMCGWMASSGQLLSPLVALMSRRIRDSKVIHTDDTPVPVQDPGSGKTKTGRLWVYLGDRRNPYVVYDYTPDHSRDGPRHWLENFRGYLQADAFSGYDGIYATQQVIEVACWAHARRKFYEARGSDPVRAHEALAWIRRLYDVEGRAKDCSSVERAALRQLHAVPLLAQMRPWLAQQQAAVLPKSPLGQAIGYALRQWDALVRYPDDGDLSMDNNAAERALRPVAVGRKNWLFAGSDQGGKTAAVLYSLVHSAKRIGLEPFVYLRDVLARIGSTPRSRLEQFLPDRWRAELASNEPAAPQA